MGSQFFKSLLLIATVFSILLFRGATVPAESSINAKELHHNSLVFDGHSDIVLRMVDTDYQLRDRHDKHHTDIPRMRQGGVDIQCFSIWVDPRVYKDNPDERAWQLIEKLEEQLEKNRDQMMLVRNAADARQAVAEGKIGMLFGMEGGYPILDSLDMLRKFYKRGVRYMTLTWNSHTNWADAQAESIEKKPKWNGLNELGEKIIHEMDRLGIMIDLSHVADDTIRDTLKVTRNPVIVSHSCCRSLCDHFRNLSDELIRAVGRNGGVIGINYYRRYLITDADVEQKEQLEKNYRKAQKNLHSRTSFNARKYKRQLKILQDLYEPRFSELSPLHTDYRVIVDHIDHVVKVAGIDHVGLGSDFDGMSLMPEGMNDISDVPKITEELVARGYSTQDIQKILGENFMRVFAKVCGE